MLDLESAIKHCEEVAEKQEITAKFMEIDKIKADGILRVYDADAYESCMKCAEEHRQLAEWLRELKQLREQTTWIPCNERLPKENEYIGDVCKYYLIQDEYGDMHVAHLSNVGWIPMRKAIGDEIIAWRELPLPYKEVQDDENNTDND